MANVKAYTSYDDDRLVAIILGGDKQAFALLMQRYLDKIRRLAWSILKNEAEAEDAVQDVFVTLLESLQKYDPESAAKFSSWIYRVAFNKIIDLKRKRKPTTSTDNIEIASSEKNGYELTLESQVSETIKKSLDTLPEAQHSAIFLFYYKDMSIHQISGKMQKTQESVKSLLKRGRVALRQRVERETLVRHAYQLLAA
jgi:RNA polymerase sigma-70 factor (ECF subfamily)